MKRWICYLSALLVVAAVSVAAEQKSVQERYIEKYAPMAVAEMYRSGVPASITLAQGILESRSGESPLASKGNNHFGIKCHNSWTGGKMYYDDDRRGECFRKYATADESFRDHSDFLRYRDRYKFLFDLKTTDYKGWAYGLKKAGYATDPAYPQKLLKLIDDYKLYEYDTKPAGWPETDTAEVVSDKKAASRHSSRKSSDRKRRRKEVKEETAIPEPPLQIEQAVPLERERAEVFRFPLSRQLYSLNGVPFIYSVEGETYASIAGAYNLFPREILRFNDLTESAELEPGTVVYLQAKKKHSVKGLDKYVCEGGETPREISQRFALKLSSLCRMNLMQPSQALREGDVVRLR